MSIEIELIALEPTVAAKHCGSESLRDVWDARRNSDVSRLWFYDGSDWRRLEELFNREPDDCLRETLLAAFFGAEETPAHIETSYGRCKLTRPDDCAEIAAALERVDAAYLAKLSHTPSQGPTAESLMASLLKGLGLPGNNLQVSPVFKDAVERVGASKASVVAGSFDLDLVQRLHYFYATAAALNCTVISGVI